MFGMRIDKFRGTFQDSRSELADSLGQGSTCIYIYISIRGRAFSLHVRCRCERAFSFKENHWFNLVLLALHALFDGLTLREL